MGFTCSAGTQAVVSAACRFNKVGPLLKGPEVHHDLSGKQHRRDVLLTNRFYMEKQLFCLSWLDLDVSTYVPLVSSMLF